MRIKEHFLEILFPPKCLLCRKILQKDELDLCRQCRTDAPVCPLSKKKFPFIDSWAAVWYYEGQARSSLLRYKFHNARSYAGGYGRLLAMQLQHIQPEGFDLLTWIPISPLRKLRRGYDQSQLLAQAVGNELGLEPIRLLRKFRHNRAQSSIVGGAQRRANVLGVYRVENSSALVGKRILLIDDIITTGATAGECARVLLTAGAKEVYLGAVALRQRNKQQG